MTPMPASPSLPEWISATAPKLGNRAEENEDAVVAAQGALRFAVCDGATEGWESRPWAARLASAFIANPPEPVDFGAWLAAVRREWVAPVASGPVPWYAAMKQEQGSFATLVGIDFRRSRRTTGWAWRAVAVGDSCLFHVRGAVIRAAFPVDKPAGFGNAPALVPSAADARCPEPEWLAGRAEPGDLFLLATDAVAARVLDPNGLTPALDAVRGALEMRNPTPLLDWFRTVQATTNDDVSLLAIRLPEAPEVP